MNRRFLSLATVAAIAAAASLAVAQQAPKPETLIKWRQSAFQTIAWNASRIKGSLDSGYNKDEVVKAANTMSAVANSGLFTLFVPGTDQGKGWHDTTARPEIFKDNKRFNELGSNFAKEATELARIAQAGDAAAVKEQFGKVSKACKSCHDDFKGKD
jgi:cytochrome c556